MSRRDALATVIQLRRRALDAATQDLAERLAAQTRAEAGITAAFAALHAEAVASAERGSDFAAWLPRGRALVDHARQAAEAAAHATEAARQALREAQTELELATTLADRRAAAARALQVHKEQAAMDEIAGILHRRE